MTAVYRAAWVVPVEGEPIRGGELAVAGERIAGVGGRGSQTGETVHDRGDAIIVPGFINAHAHLELTGYAGLIPPCSLWEWIPRLVELRRAAGAREREGEAVGAGAAMSLAAGVTCIGDISREGINVDLLAASPIRKTCFVELISGAVQPPNDGSSLSRRLDELAPSIQTGLLDLGISPHAPYTLDAEHLDGAMRLAAERRIPWTMHLLETADEAAWAGRATLPTSQAAGVTDFLTKMGVPEAVAEQRRNNIDKALNAPASARRPLFAHANYADAGMAAQLAAAGASVAWCPRAHRFFGHRPYPWDVLRSAGVNVCVGTDSLASNSSLSILDELREVHRVTPEAAPMDILRLGTINAARALGRDCELGSLLPGKLADFVAIRIETQDSRSPGEVPFNEADLVMNLLERPVSIVGVWIGGRRVVGS